MTRVTLENAERTCRQPGLGWIQHPDKRRFSVSREGQRLNASRAGEIVAYRVISGEDVTEARALLAADVAALPSVYLDPPAPPILSLIERAERIAEIVIRRRALVAELAGLDAEIDAAMGGGAA